MTITTQEQMLEEVIKKMQLIRDLSFIAEKGEDELRYATFRIRVQSRQIVDLVEKAKKISGNVQEVLA
jgi:3-polyprenyl-4-hydroxybenzoate decarboxylase